MTVTEVAAQLGLTAVTTLHEKKLEGAIASDLLSDVLANAAPGFLWVTIQTHRNVAAVASAQSIAAVVVTGGRQPAEDTVALADSEQVVVFTTAASTYEVCGRLYELGVR
ncbi:MAG: hypothetical protein IT204_05415 [Fimbriimonadaceae bacterium]|nr:hypothetical protein [Fimbriimonadaceae bacterium]